MKPRQSPETKRRQLFAVAGGVSALAAVAVVAPAVAPVPEPAAADAADKPERGGGYRVTQHVLRYYQTAKV